VAHGSNRRPRFTLSTSIVAFCIAAFGLGESPARAADGDLDPRFGSQGIVTTSINIHAIAIQSDNRIVVAGDSDGDVAVTRYNRDGSPDSTFGIVRTQLGPNSAQTFVAIDEQQRIVVGSRTGVARLTPDGMVDLTFGSSGRITTSPVVALATRPDGRIVIVASGRVAYYDSSGRLLSEFQLADYGTAICPPAPRPCVSIPINTYTILPSENIVGAGGGFLMVGFDGSGNLLGPRPAPLTVGFGGATAVDAQPDGRIVAAGVATVAVDGVPTSAFMLARYLDFDASLDTTFGGGSVVTAIPDCPLPGCSIGGGADALGFQHDGRIVAAGTSNGNVTVARYLPDGRLDDTFGDDGIVVTDLGVTFDRVSGLEIQPDGNLLVAAGNKLARYVARSSEVPRLYYLSGGSVQELARVEGAWNATDLRSEAQAPPSAGRSLAAFASGTAMESRVYYLDAAGDVQELAREDDNGTPRWKTHPISRDANAPPATPGSALAAIGSGAYLDPRVYYLDIAGMVQELAWFSDDGGPTPARWHVRAIGEEAGMPPATAGSALAAFGYGPQREPRVYYIDQSGLVQELAWFSNDGGAMPPYWHLRTISEEAHKPPAALDSTLTVAQPNGLPRVYYVTGVGDVKELSWPAPAFTNSNNLWFGEVVGDAVTNSAIAPVGETVYSILPNGVIEEAHIVRQPVFSRPLTSTIDPLSFAVPTERADSLRGSGMVWLEDSLYYISSPSGIITRLRSATDVIPFGTMLAPADLGSPLAGFTVPAR